MATYGETVSRIINTFKALSKDNKLYRRHVLKVLLDKTTFYISQKLQDKSLFRESNLFTTLDCFEMKSIEVIKCDIIEFRSCKKLMRSKKKLPKLIYSKYGASILEVTSIDGEYLFIPVTPQQFKLNKKRVGASEVNQSFYYIKDGYLYLPDSDVRIVSVNLLTLDTYEKEQCSSCSDQKCKSFWDFEFVIPDKLLEVVVSETIKEISFNRQIQEDQNPNLQDNA